MKIIQAIIENGKSFIRPLIVGIVLFYSQPLLALVGAQMVNLFISVSSRFSNYFYELVAQNNPNLIIDFFASVVVIMFWLVAGAIFIDPYSKVQKAERELKSIMLKYKGGDDDSEKKERNIEKEMEGLKKNIQKTKIVMNSTIVFVFLVFLFFSFKQSIYSEINLKNVSFQNRLTVLSVHLSDNEIKQLRAKWVKMKSADDYNGIQNVIANHYKRYNITE